MDILLYKIQQLPKVLIDCIYEYNIEHRPKIKNVIQELNKIIYNHCYICKQYISCDIFWSVDYFINKNCNIEYFCCTNINCVHKFIEKEEVNTEKTMIYLTSQSILFNEKYHFQLFRENEFIN